MILKKKQQALPKRSFFSVLWPIFKKRLPYRTAIRKKYEKREWNREKRFCISVL